MQRHIISPFVSPDWSETYIITADADIWPIKKGFFDLPPGKDLLHGDMSGVAGDVTKMTNAPLSYVGMRVRTWEEVCVKMKSRDTIAIIIMIMSICHVMLMFRGAS